MKRHVVISSPHRLRASGDRWLFGYADIVTLLFACFASLYAAQLVPAEAAPTPGPAPAPVLETTPAPEAAIVEPPAETSAAELALEGFVGDAVDFPGVELTTTARGLVFSLPEAGSFPAGSADLSEDAEQVMLELADRLRALPNVVRVEGHTDDRPIATARFASNWDLSTARATRVVQFLIEEGGIDPARLAAAGYAEHRPRMPNTTIEARARNRRVDIVVLDPVLAGREEPEAAQ